MEASARAEIAVETLHEHGISFGEAVRVWIRVALLSFGGPAGQIAVMHRILVEEKRWIGEERFLHALNYCMLLPGPEAQQLAVYIGWLLHKTKGGLVAGALFVLPGFLAILGLSYVYVLLGEVALVEGLFFGLKAAVLAVVLQAVVRVGSRALKNNVMRGFAALAFVAIFVLDVPFPLIVLAAALIGFFGGRAGYAAFKGGGGHGPAGAEIIHDRDTALGEGLPDHARPNLSWSLRISGVLLLLWLGPVAALLFAFGPDDVFSRIATFFSQMAVVRAVRDHQRLVAGCEGRRGKDKDRDCDERRAGDAAEPAHCARGEHRAECSAAEGVECVRHSEAITAAAAATPRVASAAVSTRRPILSMVFMTKGLL